MTGAKNLSDLYPTEGKSWDQHRDSSESIGLLYTKTVFPQYAGRISQCSLRLGFQGQGEKLSLDSARFCRVRWCTVCQWRRTLRWQAKMFQALPLVKAEYPTFRWLFLTLTVKNCPVEDLRATVGLCNKAFKRMSERKAWPARGWVKSFEVTRSEKGEAHPHIHCVLLVPSGYFSGKAYLSQISWSTLWQECLQVDYTPMVNIQAVPKGEEHKIIPELVKYSAKPDDLVHSAKWLESITEQLHKTRRTAVGGVLRKFMTALEEEPEELIDEESEESEDSSTPKFRLNADWHRDDLKYRVREEDKE